VTFFVHELNCWSALSDSARSAGIGHGEISEGSAKTRIVLSGLSGVSGVGMSGLAALILVYAWDARRGA
jgi:hypothetical protein